jgi:hemerythrin-like domain-containing protein
MLDDINFLDDATRPKAPRLDGLTPEQRAPGQHLKEIHDHLRDNMRTLWRLIESASVGRVSASEIAEKADGLVLVANFRRFGTVCGRYCEFVDGHHTIEDAALFPALAARSRELRAVIDRLKAEHGVVHQLLARLVAALQDLARSPDRQNFDAAVAIYRALERVLLSHLSYEEEEIGDAIGYFGVIT